MATKVKKKVPRVPKYADGFFVDNKNSISNGLGMASGLLGSMNDNPYKVNTGAAIGSGALSGAATGMQLAGPWGAAAGAVIGAGAGLIGAGKKQRQIDQFDRDFNANGLSVIDHTINHANVNPYGTQMYKDGGSIHINPANKGKFNATKKRTGKSTEELTHSSNPLTRKRAIFAQNAKKWNHHADGDFITETPMPKDSINKKVANYDPSLLLPGNLHFMTSPTANGKLKVWGNDIVPHNTPVTPPTDMLSDKARGYSNTYYPSRDQQRGPSVPTQYKSANFGSHYADGADIYEDGGGIHIKPSHEGRFTNWASSHGMGVQEAASHVMANKDNYSSSVVKMANFAKNAAGWKHEDGDYVLDGNPSNSPTSEVTNTQQNMINIQKGELLIHPETGKILQDYTGINPLTGGKFENHAKGKQEESPNNFTLADPGLFVITKKTSKQYKDALDRNDKVAQKTVLMNIRNAKIAKEGGLQKNYADGDTVGGPDTAIPYLNVPTFHPPTNTNPAVSTMLPYRIYNPISNPDKPITSISNTAIRPVPDQIIQSVQPVDKVSSYVRPVQPNNGFNVNKLLDNLTQYGPSLVNLAQGTFGNTPLQSYARPAVNPYENQIVANMPKDVDMSPIISDINATSNLANTDLLNNTNNSAVYRANRQQLASNTNRALTNARMQAQQENNRVAAERANIYGSLGEQSVQDQTRRREYDLSVDDINARRQAAKQNLFNAGLSQLQQTTQNNSYNAKKQAMDKYTVDLMSQIFPNLRYYNQFSSDNINKLLTR